MICPFSPALLWGIRRTGRRFPGVVLACVLATGCPAGGPDAQRSPIKVVVDARAPIGRMPSLFKAGMFSLGWPPPPYVRRKFFHELAPGTIEVEIGQVIVSSVNLDDLLNRLRQFDAFVLEIQNNGGDTVIAINAMPTWLSTKPSAKQTLPFDENVVIANLSPPRDYEVWANLVEAIVRHFKRELGLDLRYKIWWEPDWEYWQGTEEEFFTLYRYSILGARREDLAARIGGPGVASVLAPHWQERGKPSQLPMLYKFIRYCAQSPLPELGLSRLPIDFVVWHQFGPNPLSSYAASAKQVARWLTEYGYPAETEQLVGEWSSWDELPNPLSRERDQPYMASYVVTALINMDHAGLQRHSFTSLLEQRTQENTQFAGGFGIFTKDYIIKPVFNAFKTLSMLGEIRLPVDKDDPFINAVAGRGTDSLSVVIAHYVPIPMKLKQMPADRLQEKGYDFGEVMKYVKDQKTAEQLMAGSKKVEALLFPPSMAKDVQEVLEEYRTLSRLATKRKQGRTSVMLTFKGLPFSGSFSYKYYVIDSTHGNSFALRERIDSRIQQQRDLGVIGQTFQEYLPAGVYSQEEVALFQALLREPSTARHRLTQLSPTQQERMIQMSNTVIDAVLDKVRDEINAWPEVALTQVEERQIQNPQDLTVTLHLEPYAVGLVILEGQRRK